MSPMQLLFGVAALCLVLFKVLLFFLLYRSTYKVEAEAKARNARRRELEALELQRRIEQEDAEKERLTKRNLRVMHDSLRKNFSIITAFLSGILSL